MSFSMFSAIFKNSGDFVQSGVDEHSENCTIVKVLIETTAAKGIENV